MNDGDNDLDGVNECANDGIFEGCFDGIDEMEGPLDGDVVTVGV